MDRRLATIGVLMLALGAGIGLFVSVEPPRGVRAEAARQAPHEPAPGAGARAERPRGQLDPIVRLDRQIEANVRAAERRSDDWLRWQVIGSQYLERARLSGDFRDFQRAEDAYDRAFDVAPPGSGPFLARASLHYTLHRLDRAEADLDAAERQAVLMPDDRAAIRAIRADVAFQRGELETARRLYEEQLAEDRSLASLAALAQWRWKTGDLEGAATLLDEALAGARAPGARAYALLVRGAMERDHGRHEASLATCEAGLEAAPGDLHLALCAADALAAMGETDRARSRYEALLERSEDPAVMDRLARIATDRRAREGWRDRARAIYEEQLEALPEAAYGHALDHFLELEDDPGRAVEIAERNRALRPGGEARTRLAQAYLRAGRALEARAEIDALLEVGWDTAEAHATAAIAHELLGDRPRADEERARAEALAPGTMERLHWIRNASL